MSINDISTCLKGGKSCGGVREEDASNLLWCEHCAIALCFDCDTNSHNSRNSIHGHLRVLLPASRTASVRKCEHGGDGSSNVRLDSNFKPSPPKSKKRASKKGRGSSSTSSLDSGSRTVSSRNDLLDGEAAITSICDVGDSTVKESETSDSIFLAPLLQCEKVPSSSSELRRSAFRGGYEKAGLGPRPKQHLTWHPDVIDPICSTVSHTVGHKRAPAFLSRRSQQRQLRQKSKSQKAKKQETNKLKKSEPIKTRSDLLCDSMGIPGSELKSSIISLRPTDEKSINPLRSNCTCCIEEERLCDCVNIPGVKIDDRHQQSILIESTVNPGSLADTTVQGLDMVKLDDKKLASSDERLNESLPEDYRQLLASMLHAATSLGQSKTMGANVKYDAVKGLFGDVEMHAPAANLSGTEEAFKQATQGKISAWISVV